MNPQQMTPQQQMQYMQAIQQQQAQLQRTLHLPTLTDLITRDPVLNTIRKTMDRTTRVSDQNFPGLIRRNLVVYLSDIIDNAVAIRNARLESEAMEQEAISDEPPAEPEDVPSHQVRIDDSAKVDTIRLSRDLNYRQYQQKRGAAAIYQSHVNNFKMQNDPRAQSYHNAYLSCNQEAATFLQAARKNNDELKSFTADPVQMPMRRRHESEGRGLLTAADLLLAVRQSDRQYVPAGPIRRLIAKPASEDAVPVAPGRPAIHTAASLAPIRPPNSQMQMQRTMSQQQMQQQQYMRQMQQRKG
ncbi:hypothetical protein J8273_4691 [Carpediemonas membranifera]|uniref:Uncharacterized protein n=1 Tax=Carpediemonas membranifera TaxID=201153 RepID=A0A8J6B1Q2_9EUKA|nr:hypothetical protein J8273_4691 [Carpediemonas membranifera]|eukprot:KAG9393828.1 hypothetical protein J8273_4691 [Carpediemonas membranifera]